MEPKPFKDTKIYRILMGNKAIGPRLIESGGALTASYPCTLTLVGELQLI
jgi:hypothetical protein